MKKNVIKYLGTSGFEITTEGGKKILIDPCITGWKGKNVSPVCLDEISNIHLILVSHVSGDHLGDTLELMKRMNCEVLCDPATHYYLLDNGISPDRVHQVAWGMVYEFQGIQIRCVEAKHVSKIIYKNTLLTGLPLGFILYTESDRRIYHTGDTAIFSDLKLFGQLYRPEIGLLPIGGFPGALAELSPDEASLVAKWMDLRVVIPMHYPFGSDIPETFAKSVRRESPSTRVILLKPGEKVEL